MMAENMKTLSKCDTMESPRSMHSSPHPNDVLLGRSRGIKSHPGNVAFRSWVCKTVCRFTKTESYHFESHHFRHMLPQNYLTLMSSLQPQKGRFMIIVKNDQVIKKKKKFKYEKSEVDSMIWVEVPKSRALNKIQQALREEAKLYKRSGLYKLKVKKNIKKHEKMIYPEDTTNFMFFNLQKTCSNKRKQNSVMPLPNSNIDSISSTALNTSIATSITKSKRQKIDLKKETPKRENLNDCKNSQVELVQSCTSLVPYFSPSAKSFPVVSEAVTPKVIEDLSIDTHITPFPWNPIPLSAPLISPVENDESFYIDCLDLVGIFRSWSTNDEGDDDLSTLPSPSSEKNSTYPSLRMTPPLLPILPTPKVIPSETTKRQFINRSNNQPINMEDSGLNLINKNLVLPREEWYPLSHPGSSCHSSNMVSSDFFFDFHQDDKDNIMEGRRAFPDNVKSCVFGSILI